VPCRGAWPHLKETEAEFGPQGLKVIALSDEGLDLVEPYVSQQDLGFTVAAGSKSADAYGVSGIPHSVLIDAEGNVAWIGSPYGLSKGTVKKALKGAKRPKVDFLSVRLPKPVEGRAAKAADLAGDGQLALAQKEIDAVLADDKSGDEAKGQANELRGAIEKHVKTLGEQAEKLVKDREPEQAIKLLDAVAKEFPSTEDGAHAKKRAEEIAADPKTKAEIDAAKALDRLKASIRPLKKDKAKPLIEEFAKKYEGTRAGERAKFLLSSASAK
jgi:hypothetical protein